ncbi:unnamed protein product [Echinostoma caproni]|uniref:LLGL domain-containing protein n=1 Tax=Echinostoma caproni TaxID=27848 RepID=A0A3P8HBP7_9TREM|nr:unnamed protein product [Echinostoma caproni]
MVNGARLSTSLLDESSLFTDDLLLTGHEDGSVAFWRLSACGCLRRVYTLHTAVLFEGDFGLPVTLWQFLDYAPPIKPVTAAIKTDIPGFQWKGYAPLRIRAGLDQGVSAPGQVEQTTSIVSSSPHSLSNRRPPAQFQATGVILVQPPARVTALGLAETPSSVTPSDKCSPYGLLVALGTPHGYCAVHLPPVKPPPSPCTPLTKWECAATQTLWIESTLPDNLDALQEAAAGEGWARRRTRELKKSLRDSFRRLKRMRSTKLSVNPHATVTTEAPAPTAPINRTGVRRTVTQTNRVVGRQVHTGPLEDAERRARGDSGQLGSAGLPPVSIEREICDRPADSASVAIVTCFTFGPPLFRFSSSANAHAINTPPGTPAANCSIGSLFVGTKAGMVKAYALFADQELTSRPSTFRLQLAKQLILQHRAPILTVRLVDSKSFQPLPSMCIERISTHPGKTKKTCKWEANTDSACVDLDRSNTSAMSTPLHTPVGDNAAEYSFVFSNVGGQAVVLGMPGLTRRDTLGLLDAADVVAVNSVTFAEPGCSMPSNSTSVLAPALGLYQLAPVVTHRVKITMFDLVRLGQRASTLGASYQPIHRIPEPGTVPNSLKSNPTPLGNSRTALSNGSTADTSGYSSRGIMPPPSSSSVMSAPIHSQRSNAAVYQNTTTGSASYTGSQLNSSILSNTLSDSVRDCFTPPSGSSFVSAQLSGKSMSVHSAPHSHEDTVCFVKPHPH